MSRYLSPFVLLCLMGGLAAFSATMVRNPALPLFIASLGVDEGTLGIIAAASSAVGVVAGLPAGMLSDVWGRRRVILVSLSIFAVTPFLYLLVTTPEQLVLVRICHGLGSAILGPAAFAAVADAYRAGRGERMAWYSSACQVGRFVAPSVGGILIVGSDFTRVFVGCGFAGLLALLAFVAWRSSAGTGPERTPSDAPSLSVSLSRLRGEVRLVVSNSGILLTSLMESAQFFAYGVVETFLPLYLFSSGYSSAEIGPLFTVQVMAMALSKPALGRLSDRLGRRRFIAAGLVFGAVVVALLPWAAGYWALLALTAGFGLGMAAVTGSTSALVSDLSRSSAYGSALGVLGSIKDVGHAAGPAVVGFLVLTWGYRPAFGLVAAVLAAAALLFVLLVRDESTAVPDPV